MSSELSLDTTYEHEQNAANALRNRRLLPLNPPLASLSVILPIFFERYRDKPEHALLRDDTALRSVFYALSTANFAMSVLGRSLAFVATILFFLRITQDSAEQFFLFVFGIAAPIVNAGVYIVWGAGLLVVFFGSRAVYQASLASARENTLFTSSMVVIPVIVAFCAIASLAVMSMSFALPLGFMKHISEKSTSERVFVFFSFISLVIFYTTTIPNWIWAISRVIAMFPIIDKTASPQEKSQFLKLFLTFFFTLVAAAIAFTIHRTGDDRTSLNLSWILPVASIAVQVASGWMLFEVLDLFVCSGRNCLSEEIV